MRLPTRAELSEQQENFLMEAPFDKPVLCVGPPGTGKTVLALYRSHVLDRKGDDIDFVMYSKLLNRYIERSVEELEIDVNSKTWNSWVGSLWAKGNGGSFMPQIERYRPDFEKAIQLVLEGRIKNPQKMYWDHLVIDEGQDFPKYFYLYLTTLRLEESIVKGRPAPGVTIFADENQRLEPQDNSAIKDIEAYMPGAQKYEVTQNYRNSAPIAKLANCFYTGMSTGQPDIPENATGQMPQLRRFNTINQEMESVVNWLKINDDLSAGIIVPNLAIMKKAANAIKQFAEKTDFRVQSYKSGDDVRSLDFYGAASITIVSSQSCKGLEFDGVFIPQIQNYSIDQAEEDFFKMKMYVMVSRARKYLQISFADCTEEPNVLKIFPTGEQGVLKWKT
jgi:DNA helicase IV